MILGLRIKEERKRRHWSQDDLAHRLKVSRQSISKWEQGTAYPDIDRLVQMSKVFSVSVDSLIKEDKSAKKKINRQENSSGMTFWDFLHRYWWQAILILLFLSWWSLWFFPVLIRNL